MEAGGQQRKTIDPPLPRCAEHLRSLSVPLGDGNERSATAELRILARVCVRACAFERGPAARARVIVVCRFHAFLPRTPASEPPLEPAICPSASVAREAFSEASIATRSLALPDPSARPAHIVEAATIK